MPTIAEHIAARDDQDLRARLIAAAEMAGIAAPESWVQSRIGNLVAATIATGSTLADVHAFARAEKAKVPVFSPGADPDFITDTLVKEAVAAVNATP